MFAIIVMTLLFISFIIYFDYMLSIVGLSSCSYISSYIAHFKVPWVSGRYCVSVVLIRCLPTNTPYILSHVVDRGCSTPVKSFVVHFPYIGLHVGSGYEGSTVLNLP
jgi:hypothetical protein